MKVEYSKSGQFVHKPKYAKTFRVVKVVVKPKRKGGK